MAEELEGIITKKLVQAPLEMADNVDHLVASIQNVIKVSKGLGTALNSAQSSTEVKKVVGELVKEQKELEKTQKAVNSAFNPKPVVEGVTQYTGAIKKLKDELKAARDEMAHAAETFGEGSAQFRQASLRVGELQDKIGDLNEASRAVTGEPLERMAGSMDMIRGKLGALDFKGALVGVKQFTAASQQMTFKQATEGLGQFTKGLGTMAKALLTNPLFLLVATVVGITVALYKLKDSMPLVAAAFDAVGKVIAYVIQQGKDFLDWLGLSTFALDKHSEKIIENANKQVAAVKKSYEDQIKIVAASGKETTALEKEMYNTLIKDATTGLKNLEELRLRHNGKLTDDQIKQRDEFYEVIRDSNIGLQVLEAQGQKAREDQAKEAAKKRKEIELEAMNDLFKLQQFRIQNAIDEQQSIAENEKQSYDARHQAGLEAQKLRLSLAELERNHALDAANLSADDRKLIEEQYQAKIVEIKRDGLKELDALDVERTANELKEHEKRLNQVKNEVKDRVNAKQAEVESIVRAIQEEVVRGNKTRAEGDKEIAQVRKDMLDDVIEENIAGLHKIINEEKLTAEERKAITQEIFNLETALNQARYDQVKEGSKSMIEQLREDMEEIKSIFQDGIGAIAELWSVMSENRIANIEREQERIDEQAKKDIDAIQSVHAAHTATEEEKEAFKLEQEARISEIENQAELRRAAMERKRIQEQRKAAIFEKVTNAVMAAINGALAVTNQLAKGDPYTAIPRAIAAGAMAAVSVAAILAKQIPSYFKGTKNHPGGLARVADKGYELVREPGNGPLKLFTQETIADLPPHSQVLTHDETRKFLAYAGMRQPVTRNGRPKEIPFDKYFGELNRTVKNKPSTQIYVGAGGISARVGRKEVLREFYD